MLKKILRKLGIVKQENRREAMDRTRDRFKMPNSGHICIECGSYMTIRKSKKGRFWGCKSFPKCRNIVDLEDYDE